MSETGVELPEAFKITEEERTGQVLARNLYLERRNHIENTFINNPPNREVVQLEDGASIKVLSSIATIPENLKSEPSPDKLRVAIYIPTLWFTEEPTPIDYREVRLASSIITGNIDVAVQLKAEGMNAMAYKNEDGTGACESKVAGTAVDILKKQIEVLGLVKKEIEFSIVGYSEGSTQGASIAAKILEKGLGKVREYVSIGGGGMIGAENQNDAKPMEFIKDALESVFKKVPEPFGKKTVAPGTGKTVFIEEGPNTYYVPSEIIGKTIKKGKTLEEEHGEGLEYSVGKTLEPPLTEALRPEAVWVKRFLNTKYGNSEINPIPPERILAATTINHDYDVLAKNGVPILFFTETEDTFFANDKVRPKIEEFRKRFPLNKVVMITSNAGHDSLWHNPSGFAYLLEIIRQKSGLKS